LRRFEPRRRFIELLARNRLPGRKLLHALERTLGQIQVGFGAGHTAVRFGDGAHHFGLGCLGAAYFGVQILRVQRYQELALLDPIAHLNGDLSHVRHYLAGEHRGRACTNGSRGLVHIGPLLGAYRRGLDRNSGRCGSPFRLRLSAATAAQHRNRSK
jgi:hypothetical protein